MLFTASETDRSRTTALRIPTGQSQTSWLVLSYKLSREAEPGTARIKFNEWSERVLNPAGSLGHLEWPWIWDAYTSIGETFGVTPCRPTAMPRSSDLGPPREDSVIDPPVAWSGLVGKCPIGHLSSNAPRHGSHRCTQCYNKTQK